MVILQEMCWHVVFRFFTIVKPHWIPLFSSQTAGSKRCRYIRGRSLMTAACFDYFHPTPDYLTDFLRLQWYRTCFCFVGCCKLIEFDLMLVCVQFLYGEDVPSEITRLEVIDRYANSDDPQSLPPHIYTVFSRMFRF